MDSSDASFDTVTSSIASSVSAVMSAIAVMASASTVLAPIFPAIIVLAAVTSSDSTLTTTASSSAGLILLVTPALLIVPAMVSIDGCLLDVFLQRHAELTTQGGEMRAGVKLVCCPQCRNLKHLLLSPPITMLVLTDKIIVE
jgi:hypothetical protein